MGNKKVGSPKLPLENPDLTLIHPLDGAGSVRSGKARGASAGAWEGPPEPTRRRRGERGAVAAREKRSDSEMG